MNNTLYYGEIVAKISSKLHQNPAHVKRIENVMSNQQEHQDTIYTLCADAARVFDKIENLSSDHYIDWHKASDIYAQNMLNYLLSGKKPNVIDMVSMTTRSIENS